MRSVVPTLWTWGRMIRFSHSVFALPFALTAAFLAGRHIDGRGRPFAGQLLLIVVCMVAARSVAMTFNRIVDARIDASNPRTADRELPTGRISRAAAWAFLAAAAAVFVIACILFLPWFGNPWPMCLGGPVLVCLCGYSFTKRFTQWSHFALGAAIALAPPAAWLAIHPTTFGAEALLLFGVVALWIGGFDIIYACQDIEVDRAQGLFSLPARLGPGPALWIARTAHAGVVVLLVLLGWLAGLGWLYLAGVGAAALLLVIENALVHPGDYARVNLAFFTINGIVSVLLGGLAIADILLNLGPAL
ncbi:MAG: UbiA family prenyltransferase [Phycisphaerae bacterium]|nr:UbiA family prenyltransferase [Phycisphaerae bacterium]